MDNKFLSKLATWSVLFIYSVGSVANQVLKGIVIMVGCLIEFNPPLSSRNAVVTRASHSFSTLQLFFACTHR